MPPVLPPVLIDSHAHLNFPHFDQDRDAVIHRAREQGVAEIVNIGARMGMEGNYQALQLAHTYPGIMATVGIHPHEAASVPESALRDIEELLKDDQVVAIGEIGLDYYHLHSPKAQQIHWFRSLLRLARDKKMPVIIHDRDAHEDTLNILKEEKADEVGGIMHCFSGSPPMAKNALKWTSSFLSPE